MPSSEFAGRTVVVIGATAGTGRAMALRFAAAGANVVMTEPYYTAQYDFRLHKAG